MNEPENPFSPPKVQKPKLRRLSKRELSDEFIMLFLQWAVYMLLFIALIGYFVWEMVKSPAPPAP